MTNLWIITAYCACKLCCGPAADGLAANGRPPIEGRTCAAPRCIPLGTWLHISGIGWRQVTDRLARRFDDRIDIYFDRHATARQFGRQRRLVHRLFTSAQATRPGCFSPAGRENETLRRGRNPAALDLLRGEGAASCQAHNLDQASSTLAPATARLLKARCRRRTYASHAVHTWQPAFTLSALNGGNVLTQLNLGIVPLEACAGKKSCMSNESGNGGHSGRSGQAGSNPAALAPSNPGESSALGRSSGYPCSDRCGMASGYDVTTPRGRRCGIHSSDCRESPALYSIPYLNQISHARRRLPERKLQRVGWLQRTGGKDPTAYEPLMRRPRESGDWIVPATLLSQCPGCQTNAGLSVADSMRVGIGGVTAGETATLL